MLRRPNLSTPAGSTSSPRNLPTSAHGRTANGETTSCVAPLRLLAGSGSVHEAEREDAEFGGTGVPRVVFVLCRHLDGDDGRDDAPSALPAVVSLGRIAPRRGVVSAFVSLVFAAGYVDVWAVVGVAAFAAYRGIQAVDFGFLAWSRGGAYVAGAAVVAAGVYELTPAQRLARRCSGEAELDSAAVAAGAGQLSPAAINFSTDVKAQY
jgi:hypothetical protein